MGRPGRTEDATPGEPGVSVVIPTWNARDLLARYLPSLRDALAGSGLRVVEVHISNIYRREAFRHESLTAAVSLAVISGLGMEGYHAAVRFLLKD